MILVDTNILIAVLRTGDAKLIHQLKVESAAVCGVVRAELLCGARSLVETTAVHSLLASLVSIGIDDSLWTFIGENLFLLRSQGITAPFPDVILASLAIACDIPFWTRDQHFTLMRQTLPKLKLFQEVP